MQSLIDHARQFPGWVAERREEFERLAARQTPQALFIACSDSRVVPALITGAQPGQLFELRTAGNIVPPYRSDAPSGEAATIEFAVEVLEVPDVVVCGHSSCGAVGAVVRRDDLSALPVLRGWLEEGCVPAAAVAELPGPGQGVAGDVLDAAVQRHVVAQLERLRDYPFLQRRLARGQVRLHGWFYDIRTGAVAVHDPGADRFLPL